MSTLCTVDKRISWSPKDTDQTIREVKTHNAVYGAVCSATDGSDKKDAK